MRKVLIVPAWYPWPDQPVAGVWAREQAHAVAGSNEIRVLAQRRGLAAGRRPWTIGEELEAGLRTLRLRYVGRGSRLSIPAQLGGMLAAIRRLRREGFVPDVIHAHVFTAGFPCLLLGRRCGAPVVVSEHFTALRRGRVRGPDRVVARFTFEHATLVCPASEDLGRYIAGLAPRARIREVPNPVDTETFAPSGGPSPSAGRRIRILSIGSLREVKGYGYLLEALATVAPGQGELALDIVGEGPLRAQLEEQAVALGLGEVVRFRGSRTKEEIAELMRQADFLALSSLWENAPLSLIEAQASGLPVVATRVGGVPEIVAEDAGVLVPPGDSAALAEALSRMCERFPNYDPRQLAARAEARHGFAAVDRAWDAVYSEAIELYRQR